jgi:hypothetical protein
VADETQAKILQLLDVISVEVAATRTELREEFRREIGGLRNDLHGEIGGLRNEMRTGFDRVDRRFGNLETRVESLETEVQTVKVDLRSFRGEFERRIAPLER